MASPISGREDTPDLYAVLARLYGRRSCTERERLSSYNCIHCQPWVVACLFFFFLIMRRPPSSPLFPYPTLFRSLQSSLVRLQSEGGAFVFTIGRVPIFVCRSEEHTSELQSLRHLVCRLLLEK